MSRQPVSSDADPEIHDILLEFREQLRLRGLLTDRGDGGENIRVVIRTAETGGDERNGAIRQYSQLLGLPVEAMSSKDEADYLYQSVLRTRPVAVQQPILVLDVGETATFLAFGHGESLEHSANQPARLNMGWRQVGLENPLDATQVQSALEKCEADLQAIAGQVLRDSAKGRLSIIGCKPVYDAVFQFDKRLRFPAKVFQSQNLSLLYSEPGQQASNGSPFNTQQGISAILDSRYSDKQSCILDKSLLDRCLSKAGLAFLAWQLKDNTTDPASSEWSEHPVSMQELVGTLIILRTLSEFLSIERFEFGADGGVDAALLQEMARRQILARHEAFADILHEQYTHAFPQTYRALRNLFPEFRDQLEGRVKDRVSIADKLNAGLASNHTGQWYPLHNVEEAATRIPDGHGFTIAITGAIGDAFESRVADIRDGLILAIRSGNLHIRAIKNYQSEEPDIRPYFSDQDIAQLCEVSDEQRVIAPDAARPPQLHIVTGAELLKPSGYTTTHLTVGLRNPKTGLFDLPEVDLHLCGEKVYRFYRGADHLVYDIRKGKNIYKHNPFIRAKFESEVQPLLEAIETMPEALFTQFTDYRRQIYGYLRRQEMGCLINEPPVLPKDLPTVCALDNLNRLSNLQRALIQEAAKHSLPPTVAIRSEDGKPLELSLQEERRVTNEHTRRRINPKSLKNTRFPRETEKSGWPDS